MNQVSFHNIMNNHCPICNSNLSDPCYHVENGQDVYWVERCRDCSHYYSTGDLEADNHDLYNDEVYKVIDNRGSVYSKIIDREYSRVLKNAARLNKGSRLIDFGSGKGSFLFLAKNAGYDVIGIETAAERAKFAEEKFNLTIIKSLYTDGKVADEGFDIITSFHVLEHLPHPKQLFSNLIRHNLKENGLIVLEVPNLSSLQFQIAKGRWLHLDIPRHRSHFTKDRLVKFAAELDLKIIRTEYFSLHLGVLGMCQSILSLFGYKKKIIKDLKHNNPGLILTVMAVLPFVFTLEILSSMLGRGGIVRVYCRKIGDMP